MTQTTFSAEEVSRFGRWVDLVGDPRFRLRRRWIMRLYPHWDRPDGQRVTRANNLLVVRRGRLFMEFADRRIEAGRGTMIVFIHGIPARFGCLSDPPSACRNLRE
jgi:hypothetical protein